MFEGRENRFKVIIFVLILAMAFVGVWGFKVKKDRDLKVLEQLSEVSEAEKISPISEEKQESPEFLYVDICGAVYAEGFYKLPAESRVVDVVEMAGGLLDTADIKRINLAQKIYDQEKIIIPEIGESLAVEESTDGLININTAGKTLLEELSGVGPAYADRIIAYRQKNGGFKTKEEIMEISGIGEKTYANIEECICIY
ncbi:MAG: helix-hairpin-helix domain-containing protein [Peptostreptococcaceae bacterium]|nr:helix-hairpin-helix domain-containing protein [Peptostreptococcaceae bacterium]